MHLTTALEKERDALMMDLFTSIYGLEMSAAYSLADAVLDDVLAYAATWDREALALAELAELLDGEERHDQWNTSEMADHAYRAFTQRLSTGNG